MKRTAVPLISFILLLVACTGTPTEAPPTRFPSLLPTPSLHLSETETPIVPSPTIEPVTPSATSAPSPTPVPTLPVAVEPDWSGDWEVYIANPRISIVKVIQFVLPTGEDSDVYAEWYEGIRLVYLDAVLSDDGRTIAGTFWNSDVEALDVVLTLSPDGTYFTGTADSPDGAGQFCGARPGNPRPSPCRGEN